LNSTQRRVVALLKENDIAGRKVSAREGLRAVSRMQYAVTPHMRFGLVGQAVVVGSLIGIVIVRSAVWRSKQKRRSGLFLKRRPSSRCPRCSGFGIVRCPLCEGEGVVNYERKLMRTDPCPQCILKRWVECDLCGGRGARPNFQREPLWLVNGRFSWIGLREAFEQWNLRREYQARNGFFK